MSARAAQPHPYEVQDRELSLRQTATPGLEGGDPILLLAGNTSLWLAKAIRARREISTNWEKNPEMSCPMSLDFNERLELAG